MTAHPPQPPGDGGALWCVVPQRPVGPGALLSCVSVDATGMPTLTLRLPAAIVARLGWHPGMGALLYSRQEFVNGLEFRLIPTEPAHPHQRPLRRTAGADGCLQVDFETPGMRGVAGAVSVQPEDFSLGRAARLGPGYLQFRTPLLAEAPREP